MLCWIPWTEIEMQEHKVKTHFMRAAQVTMYVCVSGVCILISSSARSH